MNGPVAGANADLRPTAGGHAALAATRSESGGGSYGVSGEGGASSSVQRSTTYGRSDQPLHQSGAAAVLVRWRTICAGAVG